MVALLLRLLKSSSLPQPSEGKKSKNNLITPQRKKSPAGKEIIWNREIWRSHTGLVLLSSLSNDDRDTEKNADKKTEFSICLRILQLSRSVQCGYWSWLKMQRRRSIRLTKTQKISRRGSRSPNCAERIGILRRCCGVDGKEMYKDL